MADLDLDDFIERVLDAAQLNGRPITDSISTIDLLQLCAKATTVFMSQPVFLELEPPITVCGDVHAQFNDLLRLFNRCNFPPDTNYLFLGDYVDRGRQNLETICLLFAYKIKHENNFFLLRGNHECLKINHFYGFFEECTRRYNEQVYRTFNDVFDRMPLCALISGKILCMHGGISPLLESFDQIRNLQRPIYPDVTPLCLDILWSDPDTEQTTWRHNTDRGIAWMFGTDAIANFCQKFNIDLIARAHQLVRHGYEILPNADDRVVTIFSAPHYGGEYDNAAAVMNVDDSMMCTFDVLLPQRNE